MYVQQVVWEVPQVEKQYMYIYLNWDSATYIYILVFRCIFFPKLLSWLKAAAANQIGYNHWVMVNSARSTSEADTSFQYLYSSIE